MLIEPGRVAPGESIHVGLTSPPLGRRVPMSVEWHSIYIYIKKMGGHGSACLREDPPVMISVSIEHGGGEVQKVFNQTRPLFQHSEVKLHSGPKRK